MDSVFGGTTAVLALLCVLTVGPIQVYENWRLKKCVQRLPTLTLPFLLLVSRHILFISRTDWVQLSPEVLALACNIVLHLQYVRYGPLRAEDQQPPTECASCVAKRRRKTARKAESRNQHAPETELVDV